MKIYTDAGTLNNGKRGKQVTRIALFDEIGKSLLEKTIGDYTNNEGEIIALIEAMKLFPELHKDIYSDSQIAINWTKRGKARSKKLSNRHTQLINEAFTLFSFSSNTLTWIPRDKNIAGWYLEEHYHI